ncbi:RNA polymerase sigma-I factor [Bacillus cereus]|uniref:RNA polymerase sigma-I factor n=1 Tax=Bacillus cereus TaxID=1396 RepID=UPI000BFE839C|nr:RNA polymerase sigma-I factor [Bacillus cereus]PGP11887.1 RNA polymerase sigma-I factor [Bacillus cereus]
MFKRMFRIRPETKELIKKIKEIQDGDEELRNEFIAEYTDFVLETLSKITKKEKDVLREADEFSIGLIALDEAIRNYTTDSTQTFTSFAALVIKRRLVDFWRKETNSQNNNFDSEDITDTNETNASYSQYLLDQIKQERIEEIQNFSLLLGEFGIKFDNLAEEVPKHISAKRNAIEIAKIISEDDNLVYYLYEKKKLPIKELLHKVEVSKKTIERNRKYIVAVTLILVERYMHLKEYLNV